MANEVLEKKLFEVVRDFHNDYDFILGVCSNVTHEDDIQVVIDFISQKNKPTPSEVSLLSIELDQRRHPEDYIWEE